MFVVDDNDVFAELLHFRYTGDIPADKVQMQSPIKGRSATDIDATLEKHSSLVPNLIAAYTLTGSDTVASYFGIGKRVALKVLKEGNACNTIFIFVYIGIVFAIPMYIQFFLSLLAFCFV